MGGVNDVDRKNLEREPATSGGGGGGGGGRGVGNERHARERELEFRRRRGGETSTIRTFRPSPRVSL